MTPSTALLSGVVIVSLTLCVSGQSNCPQGFTVHNGSCYRAFFINVTWVEAKIFCNAMGSYVLEIEDGAEQAHIEHFLGSMNVNSFAKPNWYWIGASDLAEDREFRWTHSKRKITYTKWWPGEPNHSHGQEHCLDLFTSHRWNDDPCGQRVNFICEVEAK